MTAKEIFEIASAIVSPIVGIGGLIVALVAIYGRSKPAQFPAPAADSAKG